VAAKRKKNPKLHATAEAVKRTKAAIRNAKVADAQHAVARLSRKDAENQVVILHQRERQDETKVKAAEHTAAKQKAKGDAAVAKLSKELQAEKIEVKHAKAEAAAEMKKSQKADKAAKKNKHLTKKQIKVRNEATKHVQKAKARVAHGYAKMKHAENNAAVQVHHYEKIKNKLMHTEANEMKSKQVESQKLHALSKAKTIEQQQEAVQTAVKELRWENVAGTKIESSTQSSSKRDSECFVCSIWQRRTGSSVPFAKRIGCCFVSREAASKATCVIGTARLSATTDYRAKAGRQQAVQFCFEHCKIV